MKISVITATYNSAATLRDTFESILHQTHADIESIVVDGGSTDGTLAIIKEYETRMQGRMRWVSEPDKGIYDAMNKGLRLATGDVVGILNSDDFYTANNVLAEVDRTLTTRQDVDAVYGDVHFVRHEDLTTPVRYYSSRRFRPALMRMGFMPAHPSFYCRREVYERCGGFDLQYRVAADFENLLRILYLAHTPTTYLPLDFVTMRTGGASTSGWQSHRRIMADHLHALRTHGIQSNAALLAIRYAYKATELATYRIREGISTASKRLFGKPRRLYTETETAFH